jgi:hypothetical protein
MPKDEWLNNNRRTPQEKVKQYNKNCITFGKHAGKHIKDIPHDYLEWLLTSGAGLAWEETIKKELKRKQKGK